MGTLCFVSFTVDGQLVVQVLPGLCDTEIASELNLDKMKLAFCRENSVMLSGKEIYIKLSNVAEHLL